MLALSCVIIVPTMAMNNWNLWFLLYFLPFLILSVISLFGIGRWFYCRARNEAWKIEAARTPNHAVTYAGVPGTGKTLDAVATLYEMAKYSWEELKWEHWLIMAKSKKPGYVPTEEDKEILDAYNFYSENEGIPCLGSTIPIYSKEFKTYSYRIEIGHLAQSKRLPYRMNALVDEIGTITSVDGARQRQEGNVGVLKVADEMRFCRQFSELRLIGTEQDFKNIFIDVRRVIAENRVYKGVKPIMKPMFLSWLFEKLKRYFTSKGQKTSALFAGKMIRFKQFLNACGFLQIKYSVVGNSETGQVIDSGEKGTIYLSCLQEWKYDSRAYRNAYQAKDKPIEMRVFKTVGLTKEHAEKMLRSFTAQKKQEEKKEEERKKKAEEEERGKKKTKTAGAKEKTQAQMCLRF